MSASTPTTPERGARDAVALTARLRRRGPSRWCNAEPIANPTPWPMVARAPTNASDASNRVRRWRAASASARSSTSAIASDQRRPPSPTHEKPRREEAEPVPEHARGDRRRGRRRRSRKFTPSVVACRTASRRAWVRKPVCATIRWSGRTDCPSTCHVRWSTSSDSTMPNADPRAPRAAAPPGRSSGGTRAGCRRGAARPRRASPPARARAGRAGSRSRLASRRSMPVVDVADLDVERDVGAEEALDVGAAPGAAKSSRIS